MKTESPVLRFLFVVLALGFFAESMIASATTTEDSDEGNDRTVAYTSAPTVVSTLAGSYKEGFSDDIGSAAQFYRTLGITIDRADNLHVADSRNHRIRKIVIEKP
ncbi:MAG: hypothetical protein LBI31_05060 [Zoogloeaceae bacterium]|jgi:hypothetical protein|nr:hypothetical protein [Zoogloeaceae bacterium]